MIETDQDGAKSICLFSQRKIKKGEELTITYTNLLRGTLERNDRLEQQWYFRCQCKRCIDPTELGTFISGVKCPKCSDDYLLFQEIEGYFECQNCNKAVTKDAVGNLQAALYQQFKEIPEGDVDSFEAFLEDTAKFLHENHYIRVIAKRMLSQLYGVGGALAYNDLQATHLDRKILLCQSLLSVFDVLDAGFSRSRGLALYELALARLWKAVKTNECGNLILHPVFSTMQEVIQCLSEETDHEIGGRTRIKAKRFLRNVPKAEVNCMTLKFLLMAL